MCAHRVHMRLQNRSAHACTIIKTATTGKLEEQFCKTISNELSITHTPYSLTMLYDACARVAAANMIKYAPQNGGINFQF